MDILRLALIGAGGNGVSLEAVLGGQLFDYFFIKAKQMAVSAGNKRLRNTGSGDIEHGHLDGNVAISPSVRNGTAVSVVDLGAPRLDILDGVQTVLLEDHLNDEGGGIADGIATKSIFDLTVNELAKRTDVQRGQGLNSGRLHGADRAQVGVGSLKGSFAILRCDQERAVAQADLRIARSDDGNIAD